MRALLCCAVCAIACGDHYAAIEAPPASIPPTANPMRDVVDTQLAFDLAAMTATATVTFAPSTAPGATLEIGDLQIQSVRVGGQPLEFLVTTPKPTFNILTLALPPSATRAAVTISYNWRYHEQLTGISKTRYTLDWPYYCGNTFPCHSEPSDGTTFSLSLANVPTGETAVFPAQIIADAPAYQLAWTVDDYTELPIGTTTAGTSISEFYRPNGSAAAQQGGADLVAAVDWFEKTLGPYRFGPKLGVVSVAWPAGAFGGMEHHPFVHVATAAMSSGVTQVHESAHGWFGDGIRIACWEDFVLSEGTVSYLAARALDVVDPAAGSAAWTRYQRELSALTGTELVWPDSCGTVDIITDKLFTNAPYMRGAFFYRAVANKVGADKLDQAFAAFYAAHAGDAARMSDMLQTIQTVTGYDPTACAQSWLRSTTIPTDQTCP